MIKPTGNTIAEMVRMSPGALVWNHGDALVESARAHPKEMRAPPRKELMNILSMRIRAFLAPMRDMSSVVWEGVKASIFVVNQF
jgi:hypothetical protein